MAVLTFTTRTQRWLWPIPLLVVCLLAFLACDQTPTDGEFRVRYWYWSSRFELDLGDVASLRAREQLPLFVKFGTFDVRERQIRYLDEFIPEQPRVLDGLPLVVVYRFTAGFAAAFESLPMAKAAETIRTQYVRDRRALERRGSQVVGLQLDLDCPTRLLRRYAGLLKAVRPDKGQLSITALLTWLDQPAFREVIRHTDFYAPMAFSYDMPRSVEDRQRITEQAVVERTIDQCNRLGHPYYLGLPSYGYLLIYDADGALRGLDTHVAPEQLTNAPELLEVGPRFYRVIRPLQLAGIDLPVNWQLRWAQTDANALQNYLDTARRRGKGAMQGALIFRYPDSDDPMVIPPQAVGRE